jgi:general secretion pathway protein M
MALKLSRRETLWVSLAGGLLAVLLVYQYGISPLLSHRRQLARRIEAGQSALTEMLALRREYQMLRQSGRSLQARSVSREPGFSLFSFVENLAGQTGVNAHMAYMKPTAERRAEGQPAVAQVEMKLEGVDLDQLVRYLYGIESSPAGVFVSRLAISTAGQDVGTLDAVLQVETVEG